MCSDSSFGTYIHFNDKSSFNCAFYENILSPDYMCFNGKWTISACDDEPCHLSSYHEIDEIYCYRPESKAMCN